MFVITGATGKTGKAISENLLSEGRKVRVVARTRERLLALAEKGAEPFAASVTDSSAIQRAFSGARAAYLMVPTDLSTPHVRSYQQEIGRTYAEAIQKAGIAYIVNLSSIGAHEPGGAGPISGLHDVEQQLNQLESVHIVHVRPGFFMENFFSLIDLIKSRNIIGTALRPDVRLPMIATSDIAEFATQRLLNLDFSGHTTRELLGPGDFTMEEAARIIGKAIGKDDLSYVQFSYEEEERSMIAMGCSQDMARSLSEMHKSFNEGLHGQEKRTPENTTRTSFEDFARSFAAVYHAHEREEPAA